ncbi:MAG: adenosylmethionine--8-amino-7-oxononanoate transaminase [Nitrospiria bacterium]
MPLSFDEIRAWQKKDQQYIWHPFTQMREWEQTPPTLIAEGDGVWLTDIEGRRFLDGTSSLWVNIHGHRHPKINAALKAQIDKISHSTLLGLGNLPSTNLAEKLIQIAPVSDDSPRKLSKVFYSDNGSTAVEIALKITFAYWRHKGPAHQKKQKFISFVNAYHGDTIGSVSLGGIDLFHAAYQPLLFETLQVPAPTCYRCPVALEYPSCEMACIDDVEKVMQESGDEVAGLVIEPLIQAAAGMLCAPPGYLKKMRELCARYDILMIADEVATGFGRTGKMFACEHEGVTPDLMALSKGITGGYLPLAATLATQEIYEAFLGEYDEFKTFFHGHSYTGNPLGCAAALANLEVFDAEHTLEQLQPKIEWVRKTLLPWEDWAHVGEIRQAGFMIAIELVADKKNKTPYPLEKRVGGHVCEAAKARGLILRPLGNVVVLMPPLSIPMADLSQMVSIVGEAIKQGTEET